MFEIKYPFAAESVIIADMWSFEQQFMLVITHSFWCRSTLLYLLRAIEIGNYLSIPAPVGILQRVGAANIGNFCCCPLFS